MGRAWVAAIVAMLAAGCVTVDSAAEKTCREVVDVMFDAADGQDDPIQLRVRLVTALGGARDADDEEVRQWGAQALASASDTSGSPRELSDTLDGFLEACTAGDHVDL